MSTISQVSKAMNLVLGAIADQSARQTGCVQRRGKFTGAILAQTLVLGWLHNPQASLGQLAQMAANLGVKATPQALDQRFSRQAAAFLERVLQAAVVVQDSSVVTLPQELKEVWSGWGGRTGQGKAARKLHVRLDLKGGSLEGPVLTPGRWHDQQGAGELAPLPQGALRLADLGYFQPG